MLSARKFLVAAVLMTAVGAGTLVAQAPGGAQDDAERYFRIVAEHFGLPATEVAILAEGSNPIEELPVVLRLARVSGVSPVSLLARRRGGEAWGEIARRYGAGPGAYHLELPAGISDPSLIRVRELFLATPGGGWDALPLRDDEFVALANLQLFTRAFGVSVEGILAARSAGGSWVAAAARLAGNP